MNTKHTPEPWNYARYSKPDGSPHETSQDVAETLKFSALHSDRAELFGASADNEGDEVVVFYTGNGPRAHLNAARATACVNALAGLNPEAIKDVVDALEKSNKFLTIALKTAFPPGSAVDDIRLEQVRMNEDALAKLKQTTP